MNIVVLDARPMNAGDLDWGAMRELGELTVHDLTPPDRVIERIAGADVAFTNKVKLSAAAFDAAPNLKMVGVLATGYDVIDMDAARRCGVVVCNVPGYSTDAVAQHTIALLLEMTNRVAAGAASVAGGDWCRSDTFSYWDAPLTELTGKHMVIVGMGRIGRRVAKLAGAFGMTVSAAAFPGRVHDESCDRIPVEDAFRIADVLSLHCPLTQETDTLITETRLATMKPEVLIINTSRGRLVDEAALAAALADGRIGGYAGDVLSSEPPTADNPLLTAPRCLITPHIGWAPRETRRRLLEITVANLQSFLDGTPQNVVY